MAGMGDSLLRRFKRLSAGLWFPGSGRRLFVMLSLLFIGLASVFSYLFFSVMRFSKFEYALLVLWLFFCMMAVALLSYFLWLSTIRHYHILRKKTEKALLNLASIVESSEDAIFGKTMKGTITSWNRGAERIYGYRADEIIGCPIHMLVPPDRIEEVGQLFERLTRGETITQFETKHVRKDGIVIDVSTTLSPIIDSRGRVIGISTIARNITERRRIEVQRREQAWALAQSNLQLERREKITRSLLEDQKRSLQEVNERLEALSQLKDEFVATASHELRTPLTAIREGISLVHDKILGPINKEQEEFLDAVDQNITRLTELIDNILDLAKIEAGRLILVRRRVALANLIRTSIENYRTMAGQRTLRMEFSEVPDVFADPNRVLQVLWNLFSNAVKFTKEDGTVTFRLAARDGAVSITVSDDGTGISAEDRPKLFKKFSQVGEKYTHGTGLGLALCKEIVQLHRGEIRVDSELGRGSDFTFTLPAYSKDLALQTCFSEQLEAMKHAGRNSLGMIVFDATAILSGREERSQGRLETVVDIFRRNLYPSDAVFGIDPAWVVVIAASDAKGLRTVVKRLSVSLDDWMETLFDKPVIGSKQFGTAVYPSDGQDAQALFESARDSISTEVQRA